VVERAASWRLELEDVLFDDDRLWLPDLILSLVEVDDCLRKLPASSRVMALGMLCNSMIVDNQFVPI